MCHLRRAIRFFTDSWNKTQTHFPFKNLVLHTFGNVLIWLPKQRQNKQYNVIPGELKPINKAALAL